MATPDNPMSEAELERLIGRVIASEIDEDGALADADLDAMIHDDPDRARVVGSVMTLWDDLGRLRDAGLAPAADPAPLPAARTGWFRGRPPARSYARWAVAAAVPVMAVLAAWQWLPSMIGPGAEKMELSADASERRIVTLADGSTISLSAGSEVDVDIGRDSRNFLLKKGEALFDVAHDPDRPFVVAAGSGRVQAIGTEFNVRLDSDRVIVTVVEGTVKVMTGQARKAELVQIAAAGQQLAYTSGAGNPTSAAPGNFITQVKQVDAERFVGWANGVLQFHGEPLRDVIAEANRYSIRKVQLVDPRLGDMPIYGVLNVGDTEGLRSVVADIAGISATQASRKLVDVPQGPADGEDDGAP